MTKSEDWTEFDPAYWLKLNSRSYEHWDRMQDCGEGYVVDSKGYLKLAYNIIHDLPTVKEL